MTPAQQDPRSRILRLVDTVVLRVGDLNALPDADAILSALATMIAAGEIKRTGDVLSRGAK